MLIIDVFLLSQALLITMGSSLFLYQQNRTAKAPTLKNLKERIKGVSKSMFSNWDFH